jgi:hypothetical protein
MEIRDVVGYEGLYAVTEDGRVWSYPRKWISGYNSKCGHDGKFLSLATHSGGYLQVGITKNVVHKHCFVHRLVATAFIPNPDNKKEVNHKDGNKKNNHYSNLEWATRRENSDHAKKLNLYKPQPTRGSKHPDAKVTEDEVLEIRRLQAAGVKRRHILASYPLSKSSYHAIIRRESWTHI